jgi:hypothetical protein
MIRKDVEAKVVQFGATTRQAGNIYSTTRRLNIFDLQDKAGTSQAYAKSNKSVSASRPGVDTWRGLCSRRHAVPDNRKV